MADTTPPATTAAAHSPITLPHFYAAVVIIGICIAGGFIWHAKAVADATEKQKINVINQTAQAALKTNDQTISVAKDDAATVQKTLAQNLALIAAAKQQPVVPVDYAKIDAMIAARVQAAPASVNTYTDPSTKIPMTTVPTLELRNSELACDATTDNLTACQKTQVDLNTQITALSNQKLALTQEVAAKDKLLKGGTFWHRVRSALKHGVCGAAGVGAGILTSRAEKGSVSAAAGGAAYIGCEALLYRPKKEDPVMVSIPPAK